MANFELIVLGIYEDPQRRILLVQNPFGKLCLPGGTVRTLPNQQPQEEFEVETVERSSFEKTGLALDAIMPIALYSPDDQAKVIKVYLMVCEGSLPRSNWRTKKGYKPIYLRRKEILRQTNILFTDKAIIKYYLAKKRKNPAFTHTRLLVVETIAS